MSIGPLGGLSGSAAGLPLAQSHAADVERGQQAFAAQQRAAYYAERAGAAAGIGETDGEDHEIGERDADGRMPWAPAQGARRQPPEQDFAAPGDHLLDVTG